MSIDIANVWLLLLLGEKCSPEPLVVLQDSNVFDSVTVVHSVVQFVARAVAWIAIIGGLNMEGLNMEDVILLFHLVFEVSLAVLLLALLEYPARLVVLTCVKV